MGEWERGRNCCNSLLGLSNTRLSPVDLNVSSFEYMEVVIFNSQLNTSGCEPRTCDTPVSHSIDIPTEELKSIVIIGTLGFLTLYPLRFASTSTK